MTTTTSNTTWDPERYLRFERQRGQAYHDLLARLAPPAGAAGGWTPGAIVDLGCGPGNTTALLPVLWPGARVIGVDSSAQMIEAAEPRAVPESWSSAAPTCATSPPRASAARSTS